MAEAVPEDKLKQTATALLVLIETAMAIPMATALLALTETATTK